MAPRCRRLSAITVGYVPRRARALVAKLVGAVLLVIASVKQTLPTIRPAAVV